MNSIRALASSLLMIPLLAHAGAEAESENFDCMQLVAVGPIEYPEATLLVAMPIAGLSYMRFFQIDTGSYYANYLYGPSWEKALHWTDALAKNGRQRPPPLAARKADDEGQLVWGGKIGGRATDQFQILRHPGLGDSLYRPDQFAGTLGMPFFVGRKVLIDIRRRNFCVYKSTMQLENIKLNWFDLHQTKLRLDAEIEVEGLGERMIALVDTGAGRSDISFTGPKARIGDELLRAVGTSGREYTTFAWGETLPETVADVGRVRVFDRKGKLIKTLDRAVAGLIPAHVGNSVIVTLQAIAAGKAVVYDVDAGKIGIEQ